MTITAGATPAPDKLCGMDWCNSLGLQDHDVRVGDHRIRIHHGGTGSPLVLLHGNPTHAYLWRKTLPVLLPHFSCLAVDLAGFGGSSEQHDLGIAEHAAVVAAAVQRMISSDRLIWLAHDWGVAIAFNAVARMSDVHHRMAFTEGHVAWIPSWDSADPGFAGLFRPLREDPEGERFVVTENRFVENVLLGSLPGLTDADRDAYRAPFESIGRRRAILRLVREIPVGGDPTDMADVLHAVDSGLADPQLPKLLLYATPGAVIDAPYREQIVSRAKNLTTFHIGPAGHFTPEEQSGPIAAATIEVFG